MLSRRDLLRYVPSAVFLAGGLGLITGAATLIKRRETLPFRVAMNQWAGYEPFLAAQGRLAGPLRKAVFYQVGASSDAIEAMLHGSLDAAALTLDEAVRLARDVDITIILVLDVSHGGDVVLARPPVTSMAGLKGKRLAVETGATGAYVASLAMASANLSPRDLIFVQADPTSHERLFQTGDVDAVVTFEPMATALKAKGAVPVFSSADVPGKVIDVLAVRSAVVEARNQDLAALAEFWFEGLSIIAARSPAETAAAAKLMELSAEEYQAARAGMRFPDRVEMQAALAPGGMVAQAMAAVVAHLDSAGGGQADPARPLPGIDGQFLALNKKGAS